MADDAVLTFRRDLGILTYAVYWKLYKEPLKKMRGS